VIDLHSSTVQLRGDSSITVAAAMLQGNLLDGRSHLQLLLGGLLLFQRAVETSATDRNQLAHALDSTTISSDCKTIDVGKSIWNGKEQKPKTENAIRSVDIPATLAAFLKSFAGDRSSGFLFQAESGLPLGQSNILRNSLHNLGVEGFHCLRRFRTSHLRKNRVPWDLEKLWIGQCEQGHYGQIFGTTEG